MNGVILQPSYIPWRGYFDQIRRADVFVFYDDVQYDHHGWRNRNRLKTPQGPQWLTIPVLKKGHIESGLPINEVQIDWRQRWNVKHWKTLEQAYRRAPYWDLYSGALGAFYQRSDALLADFTIDFTIELARLLGITHVDFRRSSDIPVEGTKTERLLALLTQLGVTHYISGPSAASYLDIDLLGRHGISVEFVNYRYAAYDQLYPPYDPQVTILDLLLMKGPEAAELLIPEA